MKNDIIDCMEYLDPELIAEADEYSSSGRNRSVYSVISAAAACAALIITVNHFTNPKNTGSPEIDNLSVGEITTSYSSDENTDTHLKTDSEITFAVSENADTSEMKENRSSQISDTDRIVYSSSVPAESKASYNFSSTQETESKLINSTEIASEFFTQISENSITAETKISEVTEKNEDVTEEVIADDDPVLIPAEKPESSGIKCDEPVTEIIYFEAYYNEKHYSYRTRLKLTGTPPLGDEVCVLLRQGEFESAAESTAKAYIYDGIYDDDVLFVVTENYSGYTVYTRSEMSEKEIESIIDHIRSIS